MDVSIAHQGFFPSPSPSLPLSLKINTIKINKIKKTTGSPYNTKAVQVTEPQHEVSSPGLGHTTQK